MSRVLLHLEVLFLLIMLVLASAGSVSASATNLVGQYAKYRLSERVRLPGIFEENVSQNVTEAVVRLLPNGTVVNFQVQFLGQTPPIQQFFPNGSMIFPYLGPSTLANPNATVSQLQRSFNLTFIQPNATSLTTNFTLTRQDINFNDSSYAGNQYSGRISVTVNVTQAFNVNQSIPLLPLNIDVTVHTFPSDLVYNLTATSLVSLGFGPPGAAKVQMILLSTNLPLGDPIRPLPWYAALIVVAPVGVVGFLIYRRRRAARLASQQGGEKPSYWIRSAGRM